MIRLGIVVHGGANSPRSMDDGCVRAAEIGFKLLSQGAGALDAAVEAVRILEDDGRYNAGSGSALRMDGATIEMDASVMDSAGRLGAVAAIQAVKNPVLVAREVMNTPHVLLAGAGAGRFARARGFRTNGHPSPAAIERFRRFRELVRQGKIGEVRADWAGMDLKSLWNFTAAYETVFGSDTVGAVAIDGQGLAATANSTGGAVPMLDGRVGDTPIVGCGFYAGPAGAVAGTGIGEEIIRRQSARAAYDLISAGEEIRTACEKAVARFPASISAGIIAVSRRGTGVVANREMAHAVLVEES